MRRFYLIAIAILSVFMAGSTNAAYYDMTAMTKDSGYRSVIYETVTASDYLRAPAFGFMRFSFTKGNSFAATVYACETKEYAAGTCTSLSTLSATDTDIELTTGLPWIVIDVTTAEDAGYVSYIGYRGSVTSAGSSGSGGGSGSSSPPASGVDTVLTFYENSDHTGGNTINYILLNEFDLPADRDNYFSPLGFDTRRQLHAFHDDASNPSTPPYPHTEVKELVRWGVMRGGASTVANDHTFVAGTGTTASTLNSNVLVSAKYGGHLRIDALGMNSQWTNNGAGASCTVNAWINENPLVYQYDSTTITTPDVNGWTKCGGEIQVGSGGSNTTGVGYLSSSPMFGNKGDQYMVAFTDCECAGYACRAFISVSDRTPGSVTCDFQEDMSYLLEVSETFDGTE